MTDDRGLYDKYEVYEDGEEITEEVFDSESESPYHTTCPQCSERIEKPETPGQHDCPECGVTLNWSESEL